MLKGIDVSYANGNFNWAKYNGGFAMIKATQGRSDYGTYSARCVTDSTFQRNATNCFANGVPFGVYHYLTAKTVVEAREEAEYFVSVIAQYRDRICLWAAVDVESHQLPTDARDLTDIVRAFCDAVRLAGYSPMVYTSASWVRYGRFELPQGVPLWLALWHVTEKTARKYNPTLWQYGLDDDYQADGNICLADMRFPVSKMGKQTYVAGGSYTVKEGDVYTNGKAVPKRYVGKEYTIGKVAEGKIFIPLLFSWIKTD